MKATYITKKDRAREVYTGLWVMRDDGVTFLVTAVVNGQIWLRVYLAGGLSEEPEVLTVAKWNEWTWIKWRATRPARLARDRFIGT